MRRLLPLRQVAERGESLALAAAVQAGKVARVVARVVVAAVTAEAVVVMVAAEAVTAADEVVTDRALVVDSGDKAPAVAWVAAKVAAEPAVAVKVAVASAAVAVVLAVVDLVVAALAVGKAAVVVVVRQAAAVAVVAAAAAWEGAVAVKGSRTKVNRNALVLIIVLVVIMFLALGAYSFTDLMLTHQESALLTGRQVQTRLLVDSGVEATKLFLSQPRAARIEAGGVFNNIDRFKGLTIVSDPEPAERALAAVLSPNLDDEGNLAGLRYGLEDESTRLNLNTLLVLEAQQEGSAQALLMGLPGMTEEVADAILDWIDPDDESRMLGAEVDHYSGLNPPYRPKNGPLDTVEELLLVRGITPDLLFGADINRNGTLDPHEGSTGDSTGASNRGWSAYFTLHSVETNLQSNGEPRVYINGNDVQLLYDSLTAAGLPPDWVNFIITYRQNGPNASPGQASSPASALPAPDLTKPVRVPLVQLLDLCDARIRVTVNGQSTVIASPFNGGLGGGMPLWLPKLMDTCTINPAITIPGRININQAPAHILRGIPGMNDDIIREILSRREYEPAPDDLNKRHETWIMAEGIVTVAEMRALMPFVCAGGDVYRAQVVGYYQSGEASSRAEVIFDASSSPARVLFWRDLSHLGRGYAVETLGVDFTEGGAGAASGTPLSPAGY
jgi:hypothetical protein